MSAPTETKAQVLNRLFTENGLLKEDWFEHSQYRIITRSGIEKIQGKNKIAVRFKAVTMGPQFCVVKAIATKGAGDDAVRIETFGSAGFQADGNFPKGKGFQYLYLPEIAEKRALSRVVLKTMGFYELGVFGEDEADDFKQQQAAPQPANNPAAGYDAGVQASVGATRELMRRARSQAELRDLWQSLPKVVADQVRDDKDVAKKRIEVEIAAGAAGMSVEQYLAQPPAQMVDHSGYGPDDGIDAYGYAPGE